MIENRTLEIGTAKAGHYKPSTLGVLKGLVYPRVSLSTVYRALAEILVLDISFYQIFADFEKMKSNGVAGIIFRAGQNTWPDSKAETFMTDAKIAGMPFGSYWFYDSRSDPKAQAKLWSEILAGHDTKLWIWADYEENYGGPYAGWRHFYDFLEECKRLMPERKLGIYTGYYYWIEHSPNPITQSASLNYFSQYPLWLAWYVSDPAYVKIPKPWTELVFWQYTSSGDGAKYGVASKEVDMNKFMGTDFYQKFQIQEQQEEPMPDKPVTYYADVKANYTVNVRSTAGLTTIVGTITGPTTVSIVGEKLDNPNDGYDWYEIVLPTSGFIALTSSYENFRPVTTPPVVTLPSVLYIATKPDGSDLKKYVEG